MRAFSGHVRRSMGVCAPVLRGLRPTRGLLLCAGLLALGAVGCGEEEEKRTLEPVQLGMTKGMGAVYEDDEMSLYEVKLPVAFPIKAPTQAQLDSLAGSPTPPYPRKPYLTKAEVRYQITWTLSNLDPEGHNVYLLIDPWNEFGRYWPGMAVTDVENEEMLPNFSGIQIYFELPGTDDELGRSARRHGTFTFEDMEELAIDLGTVMNIIANAPPPDPLADAGENPVIGLVNHAFAIENRSHHDPYIAGYIPSVIPGLTGIDLGLRTMEEANVAVEIVVEAVDEGSDKMATRDSDDPLMPEPTTYITVGGGP